MVQAVIQNLLNNVRPEEVTEEEVVLYDGAVVDVGLVPLADNLSKYEYVQVFGKFTSGTATVSDSRYIPVSPLLSATTAQPIVLDRAVAGTATDNATIRINPALSSNTSLYVLSFYSGYTDVGVYKVVGYKRRISQTSLESLIAVVSQPNLLLNTWHGSPKVRNQRNFNGDWSALAIGQYGLDGWFKYSATHKAQIIEAGSYLPSKKTVVQADGIILGAPVSPSDGGNWLIAVPFDADFMDACHASIKRPYSIETDARLDDCLRQYYAPSGRAALLRFTATASPANTSDWMPISLHVPMRDVPDITLLEENSANVSSVAPVTITKDGFYLGLSSSSTNVVCYWYGTFIADATLSISDVTDDIEHRVILG
ncbi:hypothetical protein VCSRO127_0528 [Vibrio cholerae]|nr:hypothetical protein VCSRO127_0528 [Vibrio cholerae]